MKIFILFTFFTLNAAGTFACTDLWSDVKVIQALDDLAAMRMDLDLKKVEDPNSLVYGQLDREFKKKETEFIKTLGITKADLKEKIKDKIKTLQQDRVLIDGEKRKTEQLVKDQAKEIKENLVEGFRIEEVENETIGTLYRITNTKTGKTTSKLWAKEVFPKTTHNGVIGKDGKIDNKALDDSNPGLIHPDSEARKWCRELGGDLPTKEDWEELWEIVGKDLDKLEQVFPGTKNLGPWWSSSVNAKDSDDAWGFWVFNGCEGYMGCFDRNSNYSVRCVLR